MLPHIIAFIEGSDWFDYDSLRAEVLHYSDYSVEDDELDDMLVHDLVVEVVHEIMEFYNIDFEDVFDLPTWDIIDCLSEVLTS